MIVQMAFGVPPSKMKAACEKAGMKDLAVEKAATVQQIIVDLHVTEDGLVTGGHVLDAREADAPKEKVAVSIESVMAAYRKTRDEEIKALEDKVKALKAVQGKREEWLAAQLEKMGVDNVKVKGVGMAFFQTVESVTVADKPTFLEWVKEEFEDRLCFLEVRSSKEQVQTYLEEEKVLPPGINYTTFRKLMVRKT